MTRQDFFFFFKFNWFCIIYLCTRIRSVTRSETFLPRFLFLFLYSLFFFILSSKFLLLALHAWVICALQWIWTNYIKWLLLISVFFSIHLYHFFFFFLHWFLDFSFHVNSTNRSYHLHLYHILFSFFSFLFPQHSAPDKKASLINCQPIKRDGPSVQMTLDDCTMLN